MPEEIQLQQNPVLVLLDYENFLKQVYDDCTANRSEIKTMKDENGKELKDAAGLPIIIVESTPDPNAHPLCNIEGGRKLIGSLRLIMNRQNSFADLEQDEIVDIGADSVRQPINMMMFHETKYGVSSLSELETFGLQLVNSVYVYLNGLKKGGVRDFNRGVLTVQYIQKPATNQEQPTGSIYTPLTK